MYCNHRALSWAAACHSPMFYHLQNFVAGESQFLSQTICLPSRQKKSIQPSHGIIGKPFAREKNLAMMLPVPRGCNDLNESRARFASATDHPRKSRQLRDHHAAVSEHDVQKHGGMRMLDPYADDRNQCPGRGQGQRRSRVQAKAQVKA